jgi:hypothetical protein
MDPEMNGLRARLGSPSDLSARGVGPLDEYEWLGDRFSIEKAIFIVGWQK